MLLICSPHGQSAGPGHPQKPPPPAHPQRQCPEQHPPHVLHGRPLVEVLSIRANFVLVGTIAVFDGICGQIMYKNNRGQVHAPTNNPESFTDLVLTGPYVPISADGESFAFKVNISGSDEFDDTNEGTLWEFIVDDVDYVVESSIATDNGDILVTYAVLGNAVEANVQVYLVHFRDTTNTSTHVHGKISVNIPLYGADDKVWLLSCQDDEKVELIPSSAGSIVPLAWSIVAVPIGSPLMVKVSLHATPTPTNQDSTLFLQGNLNFSFGDQTLGFHTAIGELMVRVDVTHRV
ncbi:hypothetical protein ZWY2020_052720 [Hordeum vulgare]|nr:hypothetical protein ZWY2020_052720 [Hordeum vulgare]